MNTGVKETSDPGSISRIMIAVDALHQGPGLLELAAMLAARRQIELAVLFIEDVNLINLAGLPFAREVDLVSTIDRELDDLQMVRTLQSQAQKTSRLIEQLASQMKVNYSFKVLRGDYITEVKSASLETDVLFLSRRIGRYRRLRLERTEVVRKKRPSPDLKNPLCVVYDGSVGSARALALARELAHDSGREIVVLLRGNDHGSAGQLRAQAASLVEEGEDRVHYADITGSEAADLDRTLHRNRCEMLILHRSNREDLGESLVEEPDCPVILVQ